MENRFFGKRGQVTIFIIVAILIVVGVALYFVFRDSVQGDEIPPSFQPAYTSFLSCLESDLSTGISVLESNGGYIYLPDFEPGSEYMPFSSQLNFLGNPIPYWNYVSGNNIQKEQVPSKDGMEDQLAAFVNEKIIDCNFKSYYDEGIGVVFNTNNAVPRVTINKDNVEMNIEMNLNFEKDEDSAVVRSHYVSIDSNLGNLYDSAVKVYDEAQSSLFLEEYAVDTLRLYAPVDGTEISCSPQIWNVNEVFDELQNAIESNTLALHSSRSVDEYFVVDIPGVTNEVRFLNSKDWPHSLEVTPSEGSLLIANPIGNQQGLGVLGFCYVPYHFIYSIKYPVLVQVYSEGGGLSNSNEEFFQFPLAVIVQNNNPRESLESDSVAPVVSEICQYKNTPISINVRDRQGLPIEADVSYECLNDQCFIGTASLGLLSEDFPQCDNGFVTARAEGYKDTSYLLSTIEPGSLTIVMDELYNKGIQLIVDGVDYNGDAIIYFTSEDSTRTVVYSDQRSVELSEGQYEIQVYIYRDSEIKIGESVSEQCVEVPRSGFLGFVGFREERCFDIEVPEQVISQALAGGGKQNYYILESELSGSGVLDIDVEGFPEPRTIEQLNVNHLLFEESGLGVNFS